MDSQLALAAFQFDHALVLVDGGGYQLHKRRRRHRFARHRISSDHSPFQFSAIQMQCGGCPIDAIPAGRLYRSRPQLLWYSLLAPPILPPVLKADTDFIEIESSV
jgi:hypothetical protein